MNQKPGSFLGKAGPLVAARLFTALLGISVPLVLARSLSLEDYGTYKQLFLIAMTLQLILPFGMAQSLYFFVPRADRTRPLFAHTLAYMMVAGMVALAIVSLLDGPLAGYFKNPALLDYQWPLGLYVVGILGSYPLEIGLTSQGKTRASACVYLVSDITKTGVLLFPILFGFTLATMMWALAIFALVRLVTTVFVLLKWSRGPLLQPTLLKQQLLYALPFGAAMALSIPQQYAHQYAVSGVVSPELFAIYAVGCFQLPLVDLLYTPTSEVLMVRLGELEKSGRQHEGTGSFREASGKLAYVFLPLAAFLFAAAPEFIGALFGPRYLPAVPLFRFSVVGIALATFPLDGVLRACNQTRWLFLSYLAKFIVTIPLLWVGVREFGMIGGIASWAIAEVFGKALLLARIPTALSTPQHRVRFTDVLPWVALGKAALCAVGSAGTVWVLRALTPDQVLELPEGVLWRAIPLALFGCVFAAGYVVALRLAGVNALALLAGLRRRPAPARAS